MKNEIDLSREIISSYFANLSGQDLITKEGFQEAVLVKTNDEALYAHILALINIFSVAKKELEKKGIGIEKGNNNENIK